MMNYYNPFFYNFFSQPFLPPTYDIPPTVYSILNSYVNFGKDDKTKIKDLAKEGRGVFFDFNYTLSDKVTKEEFETMILNHYMMSRIGFETVTAFKLQLNVKINSMLPMLNKLFDALPTFDLFEGETIETDSTDNRDISDVGSTSATTNNTNDNRFSDTPQNQIQDVKNGSYVTNYTYNESDSENNINETLTRDDDNVHHEFIKKTRPDKYEVLKDYQNEMITIYDILFKSLDDLFYGLV